MVRKLLFCYKDYGFCLKKVMLLKMEIRIADIFNLEWYVSVDMG